MIGTKEEWPLSEEYMAKVASSFSTLLKSNDTGISPFVRQWEYAMVMKYVKPNIEDTVLDIGCGATHFIIFIAPYVAKIYGIDVGELTDVNINTYLSGLKPTSNDYYTEWLYSLRHYDDFNSGKVTVITQNARELPFIDGYFDKVYSFSSLHHFESKDDTLCSNEVHRILKPGGIFCGTVNFNALSEKPCGEVDSRRTYTQESFNRRIVKPSGFSLLGKEHQIPKVVEGFHWFRMMFFALIKE